MVVHVYVSVCVCEKNDSLIWVNTSTLDSCFGVVGHYKQGVECEPLAESTSEHFTSCLAARLWVQAEQSHHTGLYSNHDKKHVCMCELCFA